MSIKQNNTNMYYNLMEKKILIPQNHTFHDRILPFMSHDVNMLIIKQFWIDN